MQLDLQGLRGYGTTIIVGVEYGQYARVTEFARDHAHRTAATARGIQDHDHSLLTLLNAGRGLLLSGGGKALKVRGGGRVGDGDNTKEEEETSVENEHGDR